MFDIAASIFVVTAVLAYVNQRFFALPATIGLMATSLAVSLALVALDALGWAGSLRPQAEALLRSIDFSALLIQGMLSLLLFAGALHVDVDRLREYRWQVGTLAVLGTAVSTAVIGLLVFGLLGAIGFHLPLLQCLLFGALISPTDPIAVIAMLKSAGAPRNLEVVIAGESLFNDGVGVVIFALLLGIAVDGSVPSIGQASLLLLRQAGGGLLFGWVLGRLTFYLLRSIDRYQVEVMITLAAVLGGYALADHLHVSGPLAMVVAGLVIGHDGRVRAMSAATRARVELFWELVDEMLNAVLFVLVGMQVLVIRFPVAASVAMTASAVVILVTLAARWLTVGLPISLFRRAFRLPGGSAQIVAWGGLRGGLSIAMALSIPAGPNRESIIVLTYGVVAFSILVQGLTFGRVVRASLPPGPRPAAVPARGVAFDPGARRP